MKMNKYFDQAQLMLSILPIVGQEKEFALKGGTALNFFYLSLPRLSMLEPDEVKVSCPVLRGLGAGNSPRPPDMIPLIWNLEDGHQSIILAAWKPLNRKLGTDRVPIPLPISFPYGNIFQEYLF